MPKFFELAQEPSFGVSRTMIRFRSIVVVVLSRRRVGSLGIEKITVFQQHVELQFFVHVEFTNFLFVDAVVLFGVVGGQYLQGIVVMVFGISISISSSGGGDDVISSGG